jgi:hypothetical protein
MASKPARRHPRAGQGVTEVTNRLHSHPGAPILRPAADMAGKPLIYRLHRPGLRVELGESRHPRENARRSINGISEPDTAPFERAILRPLPARPARTSAEASGATVSSGVAIMEHGALPGGTENHSPLSESAGPRPRAAPSRARPSHRCPRTESGRPRTEISDEGREIREMCRWDLCGGRQMLQAVRRTGPRRMTPEDISDPSLLRARNHSGRYRSRTAPSGPVARRCRRGILTPLAQLQSTTAPYSIQRSTSLCMLRSRASGSSSRLPCCVSTKSAASGTKGGRRSRFPTAVRHRSRSSPFSSWRSFQILHVTSCGGRWPSWSSQGRQAGRLTHPAGQQV